MNNFYYIKLKSISTNKTNETKIKREATNWEKIFITKTSAKGLITQIYKELNQLYIKSSHPQFEKMGKGHE